MCVCGGGGGGGGGGRGVDSIVICEYFSGAYQITDGGSSLVEDQIHPPSSLLRPLPPEQTQLRQYRRMRHRGKIQRTNYASHRQAGIMRVLLLRH